MATAPEESSRIFVRNLPPTITQADFEAHLRKHFSSGHITDVKLIPQRRIGYVGYKTPDEAKSAVKKFHRSFIRMSKVSVEIAKPIGDQSLSRRNFANAAVPSRSSSNNVTETERSAQDASQKKRKREEPDESDPKLQEYLEVMQGGKNPAKKTREAVATEPGKPVLIPEDESDNEYEEVPHRKAKSAFPDHATSTMPASSSNHEIPSNHIDADGANQADSMDTDEPPPVPEPAAAPATMAGDDDWLRSKTNRLLDLIDDDELPVVSSVPASSSTSAVKPVVSSARDEAPNSHHTYVTTAESAEIPSPEPEDKGSKLSPVDMVHKTSRIFVRNLPYLANEEELREYFGKFGELEEIHVPASSGSGNNNNQGIAFISYTEADNAVQAFQQADGATFQGRMIHVIPASAKRQQLDEFALSKLPLKTQAKIRKKAKAGQTFNWNSLFMAQDSVLASTADRLGVSKAELLDPTNSDAAVKQALAETSTIQDTKAYFLANGVDLDSFKSKQRSDETILVKNFPYGTSHQELRDEFQEFGQVLKVLMPPTGTIAIVHFAKAAEGKTAFSKLAYRRFKNSILFLERGPKDLFVNQGKLAPSSAEPVGKEKLSASELLLEGESVEDAESSSLFVKNLSFNTTTAELHDAFKHLDGYRSSSVKTKTDPKKPGQVLSMGFGFVAFSSKASAEAAASAMDGQVLHGHKLVVRTSHRGQDAAEQRRKEDAAKKVAGKSTKIIIKNLAFEVSKHDLRSLMGAYGQLRTVRLPKNAQNRSKGYAFCEFTTSREAENAVSALKDTHLLGRKLVLEFAEAEEIDPEEVIAKMAKKTSRQNAKVTLHQLTGGDRKRVTIGNEDDGEGDF